MKALQLRTILWTSVIISTFKLGDSLTWRYSEQAQQTVLIDGSEGTDVEDRGRVRRETGEDKTQPELNLTSSSVIHLNNSHLHLMVHWAGKGSNVVFCLTRDPVRILLSF